MKHNRDTRQKFIFENANVRGELVRLGPSWRKLHSSHPYPPRVLKLLGELLSATILLSATLKFEGRLSAQLKTKGAIKFLFTECTSANSFRGMAQYEKNAIQDNGDSLLQDAILALTIEPDEGDRYQGIVDLPNGNIADAIDHYMLKSQQIDTRIWLAGDEYTVAGLLLQRLPGNKTQSDIDEEELWNKLLHFSETVKDSELLNEEFLVLIKNLYPEDDIRVFDPVQLQFKCQCNQQKVKSLLKILGEKEINEILASEKTIGIDCEFCNKHYEFDRVDTKEIFSAQIQSTHSKTKH